MTPNTPQLPKTEMNKAKLEGWKDALEWVFTQFFDHDHQMAMGEFKTAAINLLKAKIAWVDAHECFKGDNHEPVGKIPE